MAMAKWLAIGATASLLWASAASAQLKGLTRPEIRGVSRTKALDLRLPSQADIDPYPAIAGQRLITRDVAPNATLGFGFPKISGNKNLGGEIRISGSGHSRKPAITFTLRF
jgi:hypothetical protein